mmetsp:Transcript_8953/g.13389  ORF Transcript_8953/g.13389 Transcript_8953/m.13389 type:complete len:177 (+) Transcript_8953:42-572(+)
MRLHHYQIVGRKQPTEHEAEPPVFKMRVFAENKVRAISKFWYLIHQMKKMKKTTGEILDVREIFEKNPTVIENYGIWLRYDSRSGTHNMYREYRDLLLTGAVEQMYCDMAGRHRCRPRSIKIIRTGIIKPEDVKRKNMLQFQDPKVKFPLAHRIARPPNKQLRGVFKAKRPSTFFG